MGHLTRLGPASAVRDELLNRARRGPWLVPYRRITVSLDLNPEAALRRFDEQVRDGDPKRLELGETYWAWRRPGGFVLCAHPDWANVYSPVVRLAVSPFGQRAKLELTFVAPGMLLVLACLLLASGLIAGFRHWGVIFQIVIAAFLTHVASYMAFLREQRGIAEDLTGLIADAAIIESLPPP